MACRAVTLLLFGLTGLIVAGASNPRDAAAGGLRTTDNMAAGLAGEPPKRDCQQYNGPYGYYGPNWCMPGVYSYLRDPATPWSPQGPAWLSSQRHDEQEDTAPVQPPD
jgi:hypothetical protein